MEHHSHHNIIITCEHAGNHVPGKYLQLFIEGEDVLNSHRGWDPGASVMAKYLSVTLNAPYFSCLFTRLLIEPNRSLDHPWLFSEYTTPLSQEEKEILINEFYLPHRRRVENKIRTVTRANKNTIHLSIHTFTPKLNGETRNFEIGLLYDPTREKESALCSSLKSALNNNLPDIHIRLNQPYKGTDDGLTTYLRNQFKPGLYAGIELEVNQRLYFEGIAKWKQVSEGVALSLKQILRLI